MSIWQVLVDRHGFSGAYQSVKRYIRKLRGTASLEPRAIIQRAPGEEAQVDYGTGPMVRDAQTGKYHSGQYAAYLRIVNDRSRNAFRSVHAKCRCLLKAEMTVRDDIGAPVQQGLLLSWQPVPIIVRFSTNPGIFCQAVFQVREVSQQILRSAPQR
jgi:hypothetical protein